MNDWGVASFLLFLPFFSLSPSVFSFSPSFPLPLKPILIPLPLPPFSFPFPSPFSECISWSAVLVALSVLLPPLNTVSKLLSAREDSKNLPNKCVLFLVCFCVFSFCFFFTLFVFFFWCVETGQLERTQVSLPFLLPSFPPPPCSNIGSIF